MFRDIIKKGDYQVFSSGKLPPVMQITGGIQYIEGSKKPVRISDNVPIRFRDIWIKHELACNVGQKSGLAHWCRKVSESEIRELVSESKLPDYVRHRVAMLQAAITSNSHLLQNPEFKEYYDDNPEKKQAVELAIKKLTGSLEFFQEKFGKLLDQ